MRLKQNIMFTGIIEAIGIVDSVVEHKGNRTFKILSDISDELKIDESVSHDGVCLTVEAIDENSHIVTAIEETLSKTVLEKWYKGTRVNIERSLKFNDRLTGHLVQGHVDTTARCVRKLIRAGSIEFTFSLDEEFATLMIEKGSISVNGISLTIFNVKPDQFTVAIIPYTFEHTNLKDLEESQLVNIEFDMIGKYINKITSLQK